MPHQRSAAQALVFLTLALPMFISVAGLAIDGALLLSSRRELQSVADGAARAGATRLDMERLRVSGGSDVELDPVLATTAAHGYLQDANAQLNMAWQVPPDTQVEVSGRRVHVRIHGVVRTAFLRVVHIDSAPVEASAYADVQYGIHDGGGG